MEKKDTFTHIAFSNSKKGKDFSLEQGYQKYIGTYSSNSNVSSTDPNAYKWRKI